MRAADGEHTEIVEQAHEVVRIGDAGGRKAGLQFTGDEALAHQRLDDGSVMGKFLVLADEHAQFLVVDADVLFYHVIRSITVQDVVLNEVKHHIGVVHRSSAVAFLREAIVVVPRFHYLYQFVYGVVEGAGSRIVGQHLAHFLFREAHQLVKLRCEGVVGADVEAAGEVVHRHGAYSCDETTLDAGISPCFYFIEESAQVAFTVRFVGVAVQAFGVGEDGVGEVVVFVDEEIHLLSGTFAGLIEVIQLFHRSAHGTQPFWSALRQKVGIFLAEVLESNPTVRIQSFAIVAQLAGDAGEVEVEHQISITARCGVLADVQVSKEVFEPVAGAHVVVVLQHIQRQALTESTGADEEKESIRLLYHGDEAGLIHIIIIFTTDDREVHHAVRETFSAGYYVFQWIHNLSF